MPTIKLGPLDIRSIIEGTKTQHRKLVAPSPGRQRQWLTHEKIQDVKRGLVCQTDDGNWGWQMYHPLAGTRQPWGDEPETSPLGWVKSPLGGPGARLLVCESNRSPTLVLEVIGLRVVRLQDITEDEAKAEGLTMDDVSIGYLPKAIEMGFLRYEFASRWTNQNKKAPWSSNPWVWVVEFANAYEQQVSVGA